MGALIPPLLISRPAYCATSAGITTARQLLKQSERLLGDAIDGNSTAFAREDYVEEAWPIIDPVLKGGTPVYEYEPNTWGSGEVNQRVSPSGGWQNPVIN